MRVGLVAGCLGQGGAEKQLVYMARVLSAHGDQVKVFSFTSGECNELVLRDLGIPVYTLEATTHPVVRLAALCRAVCAFQPDVLQSGHTWVNPYVYAAGRLCRARAIGAVRSDAAMEVLQNPVLGRLFLRFPSDLIVNSGAAAASVRAKRTMRRRAVSIVPNVIDLAAWDAASMPGGAAPWPAGPFTVLTVANLTPAKRLDVLLRAVARLREGCGAIRVVIVGDGMERANLEEQARALGLATEEATFLGRRYDIRHCLLHADVFALTSDHEGFPNTILEAMAAGLAVVATDAGAVGDVVEHGRTGYVVARGDVDGVTAALEVLARNPERREVIGRNARARVEDYYDLSRLLGDLHRVYSRVRTEQRMPSPAQRPIVSVDPLSPTGATNTPTNALHASDPNSTDVPADPVMRVLMITTEWPTKDLPISGKDVARQVRSLEAFGVEVGVFHVPRRLLALKYPLGWLEARRAYDWSSYDIVHAQFGQSGLVAWPMRKPLVVTFRGSDLHGISRGDRGYSARGRLLQRASRWVARRADAVVVVAAELAPLLPAGTRVHIIPGGIDRTIFQPKDRAIARRELGLPPDDFLVLFVGDPSNPVKRHPLARRATQWLEDRRASAPDGHAPTRLVTLSGADHACVATHMNACDALLVTSAHEGSPNVVKEALACNLPVVSVDVGDVRRRLERIDGCVVTDGDNAEVLATALETVRRHGQRIDGQLAALKLDERNLTPQLIEVYRSLRLPR